jgi:DNA-directed RNA polymerase specialized sigma24 family protein
MGGLRPPGNPSWNAGALRILNRTFRTVRGRQVERMRQPDATARDPATWCSVATSGVDHVIELEDAKERARRRAWIARAFASLPPSAREVLTQVVIRRRSIREVARRLRLPRATLHERLMVGIRQLHERYQALLAAERDRSPAGPSPRRNE